MDIKIYKIIYTYKINYIYIYIYKPALIRLLYTNINCYQLKTGQETTMRKLYKHDGR
jgi:hypothetical protein